MACPNFCTPDKQAEKANCREVERVDEIMEILRESGDSDEDRVIY